MTGLATKSFRSGVVVTATSLGVRLLNLGAIAVLARVLVPADFGAVALGMVVVSSTQLLSTVGMGSALVASKHEPRSVAFHAFVVNLGMGLVLFGVAFALADQLAALLGGQGLGDLFRLLSVVIVINVVGVVPDALLIKHMQFGRRAITDVVAMVAQVATSIPMAFAGYGATSLAVGLIVYALVGVGLRSAISPRIGWLRPQVWQAHVASSLVRFGGTAMFTGVVRHLYSEADNVLVSRLFGTRALGFYSQAYKITNLTVQNISSVVNTVLLPVYAEVGSNPRRTADGFHRSFRMVAAITVPTAVGLFIVAPWAVPVILGPQWDAAIVLLQFLALMTLFRPLAGTTHPLFLGINRPGLSLRVAIAQALSLALLAAALHPLGPSGIALAVGLTFAGGCAYSIRLTIREVNVPIRVNALLGGLVPIAVASIGMGAVVHGLRLLWPSSEPSLVGVGTMVVVGGVAYATFLWILDRSFARTWLSFIGDVLRPLRRLLDRPWPRRLRGTARRWWTSAAWRLFLVRRDGLRGRSGPKRLPRAWQAGLPEGLVPLDDVLDVAETTGSVEHQHLSGWKSHGAWRIRWQVSEGESRSVIFKDATYDLRHVPAVRDLPLHPGPPEWRVYGHDPPPHLGSWMPGILWSRRDPDRSHFQYLMEDLQPTHRPWRSVTELLWLAELLPGLHTGLTAAFAHDGDGLVRLDEDASLALVDYFRAGLVERIGPPVGPEAVWVRESWPGICGTYTAEARHAHATAPLVGIHGDPNPANVLFPRDPSDGVKLIDWEWAGLGVAHADLASICKALPRPVERAVVRTYRDHARERSFAQDWRIYLWCKLQRGLLDAAFLGRQRVEATHVDTALPLATHVEAALGRAHRAHDALRDLASSRS